MNEFEHGPRADHRVEHVTLPSGKRIEVVRSDDRTTAPAQPAPELHRCPACESHLVYPIDWEEARPAGWRVWLRCPECEWTHTAVFGQSVVDRFDEELDRGTDALVDELRRIARANLEEDIARFVTALEAGWVLPEDF